jgi:hypothetical protein
MVPEQQQPLTSKQDDCKKLPAPPTAHEAFDSSLIGCDLQLSSLLQAKAEVGAFGEVVTAN